VLGVVSGSPDGDVVGALLKNGPRLLEVGFHGRWRAVDWVVSMMLRGDHGLEKNEDGEEHAEGTSGGAECGHGERLSKLCVYRKTG